VGSIGIDFRLPLGGEITARGQSEIDMKNIRQINVYKVLNGYTVDLKGEKDGNPFYSETRIAVDMDAVKRMLDEMLV
jgi:hypothetical protein